MPRAALIDVQARQAGSLRVLFVALANDVGIDRLPAALGALGAECAVLCPPGYYCAMSRFIRHRFALPAHRGMWLGVPFIRTRLEAAIGAWPADLIVPLDNVAAQLLRVIAKSVSASSRLRALLVTSLGAPEGYADACSRSGLMRMAAALQIPAPRFCVSRDPSVFLRCAGEWGYPVVLKMENTCGGHGVTIASSPDELRLAMTALRGGSVGKRLRGLARNKVWSLAGIDDTAGAPPLLQSFARGVPAMRTVSAWQGRVLEGVSFIAERTHPGPTGPSTMVRSIENSQMEDAARRLVSAMGCSGFVSFDFMLDEATGEVALIELNPRPIGTTHLGRRFGHDPCAALLACISPQRPLPAPPAVASVDTVALFPKEIEREPNSLWRLRAADVYHDVPYDEPAVVTAYLRRLSRLHPAHVAAIREAIEAWDLDPGRPPTSNRVGIDGASSADPAMTLGARAAMSAGR
jgi:hypothetical protein